MQPTHTDPRRSWRARRGAARMTLWKLGTLPYNAIVVLATGAVLAQSRVWKIRAA